MSEEAILGAENSEKNLWAVRAPPRTPLGSSEHSPDQWCGLRPSVLGQDRSETKKIGLGLDLARSGLGLGLAGFVLCCEIQSCPARRQKDLGGHSRIQNYFYHL